ncbi:hypothetical protein [Neolewinella agarilytica]|uniref:competence protein CoiA family protein n=1 Tax=Neolewinella agarilytica TaxID=478744 RepID=UPI0023545DC2|nr:hypothetical protein [Neolewinella agarilytica]
MRKLPLIVGIGEDGKIVPIRRAKSGLKCRCFCPGCGAALSAKKGKVNAHHFAHHGAGECPGGIESGLHRFAKAVLHHHSCLLMPPVLVHQLTRHVRGPSLFKYHKTSEEVGIKGFVADVLLYGKEKLVVELKVSHAVDSLKERAFIRAGIPSLEIDVLAIFRELVNESRGQDTKELARRIINFGGRDRGRAVHGRWLFNPLQHQFEYRRRKTSKQLKVKHSEWRGYHHFRTIGCPCPRRQRFYGGDNWSGSYARTYQDCIGCPHLVEMVYDNAWVGYQWTPVRVKAVLCGWSGATP